MGRASCLDDHPLLDGGHARPHVFDTVDRDREQFTLGVADKGDRGTTIEVKLKENAKEFASAWRLEQIVRKHSDYVAFPIYVGDRAEPVNRQTALWRQPPSEVTGEQYDDFYKHLTLDTEGPLLHAHLRRQGVRRGGPAG